MTAARPTRAQKERMLELIEEAALEDAFRGVETELRASILIVRLKLGGVTDERRIAPSGEMAEPLGEGPARGPDKEEETE